MTATPPKSGTLELVCVKCRRFSRFPAENKAIGSLNAQQAGWVYRMRGGELCPKCAGKNREAAIVS